MPTALAGEVGERAVRRVAAHRERLGVREVRRRQQDAVAALGGGLEAVHHDVEVAALERRHQVRPVVVVELGAHAEPAGDRVDDVDLEADDAGRVSGVLVDVGCATGEVGAVGEHPRSAHFRQRVAGRGLRRARRHQNGERQPPHRSHYNCTVDLARMLDRCVRDQWSADDLDWSAAPPLLPADKEAAVVHYFTDMAGIELLAGALFDVERARAEREGEAQLAAIFATFVVDEQRHSDVARRLAAHYDVRHARTYVESPALTRFRPHFLHVVRRTSPEIANAYITSGELILDVALLRSIDDYVADATSHAAMELVNRDESRHIAVDFHMTERYSSPAHQAAIRARPWPGSARGGARACARWRR